MRYYDALQSVISIVNMAFAQYQNCKHLAQSIETKDIDSKHTLGLPVDYKPISFRKANLILNIALDLEE